jgi:glycosyltransferase involved in cell wall biosynthesis
MRERLRLLRATPEYEEAFSAPDPLVTVAIPTYDGYRELVGRALPSVLAQTYRHIEVIVVGDAAPPETGRLIAELEDERITYVNLNRRGPYPEDDRQRWLVAGAPPYNEAVARARGLWLAAMDDDDALTPDHLERLLAAARRDRYEVCYGRLREVRPDGDHRLLGEFPPRLGQFGWQAAIYHAGLRFFEAETADALFGHPSDWGMCRRMLRAGVRFGMVEAPVVDYYPSQLWRANPGGPPT